MRHGQTSWNLEKRTQGGKDSDLTALGIRQAESLRKKFQKIKLDSIYTSPLKRAYTTAQMVAKDQNLNCIPDDRLVEMNFGDWEGLTHEEIRKFYPEEFKIWRMEPHMAVIPNGETISAVQERMVAFLNDIIIQSNDDNILVVSHSATIKLLLLHILSMNLNHYYNLQQDNCAINLVTFKPYGPVLVKYNDICHMDIMMER